MLFSFLVTDKPLFFKVLWQVVISEIVNHLDVRQIPTPTQHNCDSADRFTVNLPKLVDLESIYGKLVVHPQFA